MPDKDTNVLDRLYAKFTLQKAPHLLCLSRPRTKPKVFFLMLWGPLIYGHKHAVL